jgi:hypothetical protein
MRWHRKKPTPKNDPRQGLLGLTPDMAQNDIDRRAWLEKQQEAAHKPLTASAETKPSRPQPADRPTPPPSRRPD